MDPIVASAVSALSAGALAVGKGLATEAIKDGYKALKSFLIARFAPAAPFVEVVDRDPSETTAALLAKQLAPAAAGSEAETLAALTATLRAAIEAMKSEAGAGAVFQLLRSKLGDVEVVETTSSRPLAHLEDSEAGKMTFRNSAFTGGDKKKA